MDIIENIRYKLRCFGVDIDEMAEVLCDNKYVVKISSAPASVLSKHHNYIFCHRVRESQAYGMVTVQWIPG